MVEGEMKEVSETAMIEAISFAHEHIKIQCNAQLGTGSNGCPVIPESVSIATRRTTKNPKAAIRAFTYNKILEVK